MIESWTIKGKLLEYIDETHTYIYDGIVLPSITQILKLKFGNKYAGVSERTLDRASELGTMVHKKIEEYETKGIDDESCKELHNYKFLKERYGFKCLHNEIPIVLFLDQKPVGAGRIDLIIEADGKVGIADIKRTSTFDKEYVAYQTNLYRIGYQQSYDEKVEFLRGIHLRENVRKYITLPINEEKTLELLKEYLRKEETNE